MPKRPSRFASGLATLACAPALAAAQDTSAAPVQAPNQDLKKEIEELRKKHDREIEDLRDEIDRLSEEAAEARRREQVPAQQSLSIFNPAITVFGNFLYRDDDQPVFVDNDPSEPQIDDRFLLREVELDLRAPIDPWADGVLITTFEAETPGDYEASVEEGYVLLKKLPGLDSAPAGLKLKIGRFRPTFGRFNTIHLHDLPQTTYPIGVQDFLGTEGFIADGISGEFFLPSPSEKDVLDATVQVIDGGNIAVAPDGDSSDLATNAHLKWFRDLVPGQDLEIGTSVWTSNAENQLYGLDATYRWKPFVAGEWKSFLVGAEIFHSDLDDGTHAPHPGGWDLWSQYQLDRNLYVGARYGQAEDLDDESLLTQSVGAFLTYYTTEFLRFRVGVEHTESDESFLDDLNTAFFELNFIYGSHPAEPYWVNR